MAQGEAEAREIEPLGLARSQSAAGR